MDCLGKNTTLGFCFVPSETEESIMAALKELGLENDHKSTSPKVVMSDGAAAFSKVVREMGFRQMRCIKHYKKSILEASAGLKGSDRKAFFELISPLIYEDMGSNFEFLLQEAQLRFQDFPNVNAIDTLQQTLCRSHTIKCFSAGGVSSQRVEGYHGTIKGPKSMRVVQKTAKHLRSHQLFGQL